MSSAQKNWLVILGVAISATAFSAIFLNVFGMTDTNLQLLLRLTARISFLIFLVAFIARPLTTLLVTDATRWLLRNRRLFGLAFASNHTVHLGVIILQASLSTDQAVIDSGNIVGALVYSLIFLLAITSFDGPARAIGPRKWQLLHKTGLYVIGLAFVQTLLPANTDELLDPTRSVFVLLTAAAILIRVTAFLTKPRQPL